jgi:beta-1,2-mannobiose phosphorylase / 1,2-beta-oligomannan phosphorylase
MRGADNFMIGLAMFETRALRRGTILEPADSAAEAGGILNPAAVRTRDGALLLYPRVVAAGNVSRIGIVRVLERGDSRSYVRAGYALEPECEYELRAGAEGYGCEDPRVTFIAALDSFVMAYTAFGPRGPRIAFALSKDGLAWQRLGLVQFHNAGLPDADDKDAAFFPAPVRSPLGFWSLAFYHRPMPAKGSQSIRIAYVPLEPVLRDVRNLVHVQESCIVLRPGGGWGALKVGAGTPPILTDQGWLSVYHGVDASDDSSTGTRRRYAAGILIHDAQRPHIIRYRSHAPFIVPETEAERRGVVNNVVFPTGIDHRPKAPVDEFDVYYGMGDERIGLVTLSLNVSSTFALRSDAA